MLCNGFGGPTEVARMLIGFTLLFPQRGDPFGQFRKFARGFHRIGRVRQRMPDGLFTFAQTSFRVEETARSRLRSMLPPQSLSCSLLLSGPGSEPKSRLPKKLKSDYG